MSQILGKLQGEAGKEKDSEQEMKGRDRTFPLPSPRCLLTVPSFYSLKGHSGAELALELGGTGSILPEWQQLSAGACRVEQSLSNSCIPAFLLPDHSPILRPRFGWVEHIPNNTLGPSSPCCGSPAPWAPCCPPDLLSPLPCALPSPGSLPKRGSAWRTAGRS